MSNDRSEMDKLARQFFRENKKALELVTTRKSDSSFAITVCRLVGDNPQLGKPFKIANRNYIYSGFDKNRMIFLPARWREELDKMRDAWPGCENWWAGYPFILWVELRLGDDGTTGYLRLNAEVGPISDQRARKGIIEAIKAAASSANSLERIHFEAGAADKGRLYSRFLRKNSIIVSSIHDANEVEKRFVQLVADFEPEFELVMGVIPQFPHFRDASWR
ncbi:hypothetical protein [Rhizobium ruizarguesonis]|uniref:hypothetical protein n=1 Tax=Rhizobium ruizarguesonis TaxID=2081791 RepID=UPI0010309CC3|nr:hypothetical protein [Rhizobium ruizarguesonis]TAW11117.1 hypothetical protein ELI26_16960 [Rhizobium ruizarguesonis]